MINVNKVAKKLKFELGKNITLNDLKVALRRRGYTLLLMSSADGQEQLRNLSLTEFAKEKRAFTVCTALRIVFINDNLHEKDLVKLTLHEIAHIDLGHVDYNEVKVHDDVSQEIEADTVVYKVLNNDHSLALRLTFLLSLILLILSLVSNAYMYQKVTAPAVLITNQMETITEKNEPLTNKATSANDLVYVTPSGNKYHEKDCQYVNIERAKALSRSDAEANYAPCKVCRP